MNNLAELTWLHVMCHCSYAWVLSWTCYFLRLYVWMYLSGYTLVSKECDNVCFRCMDIEVKPCLHAFWCLGTYGVVSQGQLNWSARCPGYPCMLPSVFGCWTWNTTRMLKLRLRANLQQIAGLYHFSNKGYGVTYKHVAEWNYTWIYPITAPKLTCWSTFSHCLLSCFWLASYFVHRFRLQARLGSVISG